MPARGLETLKLVLRKKTAIAGVTFILFFAVLGGLAPVLSPYTPKDSALADDFARPEWAADPKTPRNVEKTFKSFLIVDKSVSGDVKVEFKELPEGFELIIYGTGNANVTLESRESINYVYRPAGSMLIRAEFSTSQVTGRGLGWYNVELYIVNKDLLTKGEVMSINVSGKSYRIPKGIYSVYDEVYSRVAVITQYVKEPVNRSLAVRLPNPLRNTYQPYIINLPSPVRDAFQKVNAVRELLLAEDTELKTLVRISYMCSPTNLMMSCSNGGLRVVFKPVSVFIKGEAFGILGTNYLGNDIWTQFIYGARSAVSLGVAVASTIVLLGMLFGLMAGYRVGTAVDHVLTFVTDVIYFIPTIPLTMVVGIAFGRSLWNIYLVLIALAWPGTARTIRHWTSVLKSNLYIEAAKAIGASEWRILLRHIAPQLVPFLVYAIVMGVPGVIFFEAGIQLLGFGDPEAPTWGRMISEAYWGGAFLQNAWWWILPPIIGLILLASGFVLLGIALDEVVNPRLRR